jgi:hypothetical protein
LVATVSNKRLEPPVRLIVAPAFLWLHDIRLDAECVRRWQVALPLKAVLAATLDSWHHAPHEILYRNHLRANRCSGQRVQTGNVLSEPQHQREAKPNR